jgi:calcineurin-like phosphoesterase family protein
MNRTFVISLNLGIWLLLNIQLSAQENASFQFIVEPYLQQVTDTSFSVLWETSGSAKGMILWGEAEFNVLKPNLREKAEENVDQYFHRIMVKGVKPGGAYFYKVVTVSRAGDTIASPITPINIPDYSKMPISFAVIGDTQFEHKQEIWGPLSELIFQERPSFVIHVGDLVGYGPNKSDWVNEFFKPARNLLRFYPLYPTLGNHEQNSEWYFRYFDLPEPEWFYTIKKGNVLFIFADTHRDILPGSEQYDRLEKVLASAQEEWKIMVHHHPVYVSEEGFYGNTWYQKAVHGDPNEIHLKKLYEMYGVDLVLNGHAHFYERTWPIANDSINTQNGVTYITTGGGNSRLSKFAVNKSWYDARTRVLNHFLYINELIKN